MNLDLDLTGVKCPMNYVKIKLALELWEKPELIVKIDKGEPALNVTRSLKSDGIKILSIEYLENSIILVIETNVK